MASFRYTTKDDIAGFLEKRPGETRLGEMIQVLQPGNTMLENTTAKFVVLTIPEDIGIRADHHEGGAHTICEPALKELLNIQHTNVFDGSQVLIMGTFDFTEEMQAAATADVKTLRELVSAVDEAVYPVIQKIVAADKIPIIISGGHNNAYPILKGVSNAKNIPINCINLDRENDFHAMDGRHHNNSFRYAHREGYLEKYAVLGLQENCNPQETVDEVKDDPDLIFTFFEDIFLREQVSFYEATRAAMKKLSSRPVGLEVDLGCIECPAGGNPSGITTIQARRFVTWVAHTVHPVYMHLAEGKDDCYSPRLIAYLISDFIKAYNEKRKLLFS